MICLTGKKKDLRPIGLFVHVLLLWIRDSFNSLLNQAFSQSPIGMRTEIYWNYEWRSNVFLRETFICKNGGFIVLTIMEPIRNFSLLTIDTCFHPEKKMHKMNTRILLLNHLVKMDFEEIMISVWGKIVLLNKDK